LAVIPEAHPGVDSSRRAYAFSMRFGVLGPLEVRGNSGQLTIKGVKERRLLGLLVSRANSVVPVDDIIVALWGTAPPASAAKSVQVYVVRVRKMLATNDGVAELISRRGSGYVLCVDRDQVDALRFADLVARARQAVAGGAHDVAALVLRDALGLWRGAPHADFQDTWFGTTEAAHLGEMRLSALEARIDADLALGRHGEVIAELESLVREYPLRERFWALLMLALYRCGRQSDALLAFQRARSHLVGEMGVEPGPELRAVEAAILAHDPALAAPDPRLSAPPELPAELRRVGPVLVVREEIVRRLHGLWAEAEQGRGGVVLIAGPAGCGRSRLAAELAQHAHARGAVVHLAQFRAVEADVAGLVRSAGVRPVLLVLDDVDRCGPEAVALLEAAAEMGRRLRLLALATYDPAGADAGLHALELRAGAARLLRLPPLAAGDAAVIVHRYLRERAEPRVVARIVAQGQGLPGRLHELAADWVEAEAARRVLGAVSQAPAARHALSAVRSTVRDGVLDLHRVREERAAQAGAGVALCPYKGLARFEKDDAPIFHGREALVATLVARLADTALIAVVGPSGAGKSSVVRAGLLPALSEGVLPGSGDWQQYLLTPGATPRRALAPVLEDVSAGPAVVVVDQFEELFTACEDETEPAGFIADLLGVLERDPAPVRVLLTVRADYLGWCAGYPQLASRLGDGTVLVAPMTDEEVRRAVTAPGRYAGLAVEDELLDAVVADVRGRPGGLPLLSTALLDTWQRRRGNTLTHAGYLASGGVSGALARLAEAAYARLDPAGQQAARRILVRLAETGEAGAPVRRRVPLEEAAAPGDEAARQALEVLVARRLLTASEGSVEVAHEALLSHWPRLARWLEDDEQGRTLRRHLAPAARGWAQSGRPDAELYRGARLASALDWAAGHAADLNPVETEFLDASRIAAEHELREQRQRADREARARRRLRLVLAAVSALLLLSAAAGVIAVQQRGTAVQQRHAARAAQRSAEAAERSAEARRLGARALTEPDLDRALLLAAAAVRTDPSLETDGDLLAVLNRSPHALAQVRGDGDRLLGVAVSPDGRTFVASDRTGTLVFWDTRTMRRIGRSVRIGGISGYTTGITFATQRQDIAVMSASGSNWDVVLWDVAAGRLLHRVQLPANINTSNPAQFAAWTRDDRAVAVGSGTGFLTFYNAATGRKTGSVPVRGADAAHPLDAYAAGDNILAVPEQTREAVLIDPSRRRIVRTIPLPVVPSSLGVSRDGRTLAIGTAQGTVSFMDLPTGRPRNGHAQHTGPVRGLAFAPGGRVAASTGNDGSVIVWDAATGEQRLTLPGHAGPVTAAAFAPDGQTLDTAGFDGSVLAWDMSGQRSFGVTRPNAPRGPFPVDQSNDGPYVAWSADRRVVIGFSTGTVAVIDTATGEVTARGRPVKELEDLAVSPDGRFVYIVSSDRTLRRWAIATRRVDLISTLGTPQGKGAVTVSPDGHLLAVSTQSDDPRVRTPVYVVDAATFRRVGHPIDLAASSKGLVPSVAITAFSRDGRLLALGSVFGPGLAVADAPTGHITWTNSSFGNVTGLGFSADGRHLVAGSYSGALATFDATSGHRLAGPVTTEAAILAASYSPDGRIILTSGGVDGAVRLRDASALRPVGKPIPAADNMVVYAAFGQDGSRIIALDVSGRVLTWPATEQAWLQHACAVTGRNFTPAERSLYAITSVSPPPCP
jgi:WD40 repeat protein/DNA-binding SARP family transcriptional activator